MSPFGDSNSYCIVYCFIESSVPSPNAEQVSETSYVVGEERKFKKTD